MQDDKYVVRYEQLCLIRESENGVTFQNTQNISFQHKALAQTFSLVIMEQRSLVKAKWKIKEEKIKIWEAW